MSSPRAESSQDFASRPTTPIAQIVGLSEKCNVIAMVITKSELRAYPKGGGMHQELFQFTLRDESNKDIEVIAYAGIDSEELRFHKLHYEIFLNKCYKFSDLQVFQANQYNMTSHKFQLNFSMFSKYEYIGDSPRDITPFEYKFQSIDTIEREVGKPASILAVVLTDLNVDDQERNSQPIALRRITVMDQSNSQIVVKLWEHEARKFDTSTSYPIIYLYGARVATYQEEFLLDTQSNSMMLVNPNIQAAHALRLWFNSSRNNITQQA